MTGRASWRGILPSRSALRRHPVRLSASVEQQEAKAFVALARGKVLPSVSAHTLTPLAAFAPHVARVVPGAATSDAVLGVWR